MEKPAKDSNLRILLERKIIFTKFWIRKSEEVFPAHPQPESNKGKEGNCKGWRNIGKEKRR